MNCLTKGRNVQEKFQIHDVKIVMTFGLLLLTAVFSSLFDNPHRKFRTETVTENLKIKHLIKKSR